MINSKSTSEDSAVDTLNIWVLEAQKELLCCMHPGVDVQPCCAMSVCVWGCALIPNNPIFNLLRVMRAFCVRLLTSWCQSTCPKEPLLD